MNKQQTLLLQCEVDYQKRLVLEKMLLVTRLSDQIQRVREIIKEWENDIASTTEENYFNQIFEALDGEQE